MNYLIIIILVAIVLIFLNNKKKKTIPDFDSYMLDKTFENQSISIEELLNNYIEEYNVALKSEINEPKKITEFRTKVGILEESTCKESNDQKFNYYLKSMKMIVDSYDKGPQEYKDKMKEKFS